MLYVSVEFFDFMVLETEPRTQNTHIMERMVVAPVAEKQPTNTDLADPELETFVSQSFELPMADYEGVETDDAFGLYMAEIRNATVLNTTEEQVLLGRIVEGRSSDVKEDDDTYKREFTDDAMDARNELIYHNQRLVISVATKYWYHFPSRMDAILTGNIGLVKAIAKFDMSKGNKFSTYATWWIRQSLSRELEETGRAIRIPAWEHAVIRQARHAETALLQSHPRKPTTKELADFMGMEEYKVLDALSAGRVTTSLDEPLDDGNNSETVGEKLADVSFARDFPGTGNTSETVADLLAYLTPKERRIIELQFGLFDGNDYSQKDVSKISGHSIARVSQIKNAALEKMQIVYTALLNDEPVTHFPVSKSADAVSEELFLAKDVIIRNEKRSAEEIEAFEQLAQENWDGLVGRYKVAVGLRVGMIDGKYHSYLAIAEKLGVTKQWTNVILEQAQTMLPYVTVLRPDRHTVTSDKPARFWYERLHTVDGRARKFFDAVYKHNVPWRDAVAVAYGKNMSNLHKILVPHAEAYLHQMYAEKNLPVQQNIVRDFAKVLRMEINELNALATSSEYRGRIQSLLG
jgi:RNA polymerase primary sigma factor